MIIKSIILASFIASVSSISFADPVNRGKLLLQNSNITIINLGENHQLKAAGVKKDDVLLDFCDTKIIDMASFQKADEKLQVAEKCEIKVKRGSSAVSLQFIKGR